MSKEIKYLFIVFLFLVLMSSVYAEQKHIKLLAVSEYDGEYKGVIADLYLESRPGKGRVFINTQPLTKFDTQLSTRLAKEIACDTLNVDCSEYDFFYEIKADSVIVGGPSAGSAVALLTVAAIKDLELREDVAITGIINPGGLIGPVGGLKEKIEAAEKHGISKVLIPNGEIILINNSNLSANIIEVSELNQAIYEFTGENYSIDPELIIDDTYTETMKNLAVMLCTRNTNLKKQTSQKELNEELFSMQEKAINLSSKGKIAFDNKLYYSAASYCFGSNVEFKRILLETKAFTKTEFFRNILEFKSKIKNLELKLENKSKKTITDLQTHMVVRERLIEAGDILEDLEEKRRNNIFDTKDLAYADERIYSAITWSEFFDKGGKEFELTDVELKKSCLQKISEAKERVQYIGSFYPFLDLNNVKRQINHSREDYSKSEYALCLFKAAKAKADVDVILSTVNMNDEYAKEYLRNKLGIIRKKIAIETQRNAFPILAYSYYELSNSLIEEDLYSALIYSEYALELSDLEIYFKEKESLKIAKYKPENIGIFLLGISFGIIIAIFVVKSIYKIRKRKK